MFYFHLTKHHTNIHTQPGKIRGTIFYFNLTKQHTNMHKQRGKIRGTITDQIIFRLDFLTLKDLVLLKISPATMK